MTDNNAPTITIDGVTSNPGKPVSMLSLGCGCHPFANGHWTTGAVVFCEDCARPAYVTDTFHTWLF